MDYHYHARLTIVRREQLAKRVLDGSLSLNSAMAEFKLSRQSAAKWVSRYKDHGVAGVEGPQFAAASFSARHVEGEDHRDRTAKTAALDRRQDRAASPAEPRHGEPRSAPVEAEPHPRSRTSTAAQPL